MFKIILSRVGGWLDFVVIIPPQPSLAVKLGLGFGWAELGKKKGLTRKYGKKKD